MAQLRQNMAAAGGGAPHGVSLKVLRLSRPSLIATDDVPGDGLLNKASKAYPKAPNDAYPLTPLLQLPPAFGAAYVGTTFSCTLCANNELVESSSTAIGDVQVTAELQTPAGAIPLELSSSLDENDDDDESGVLQPGQTVQRIVRHDLREDGQHVLAVTVTYTEMPKTQQAEGRGGGGNKRTFRKLYQFIAQPAVGVRTKIGELKRKSPKSRKFVLEAQLENLTEATAVLESVRLNLAKALVSKSLNWDSTSSSSSSIKAEQPVLAPLDVMQVAFVLEQKDGEELEEKSHRVLLAQIHVEWRGPMGEKGELTTGWLGCKAR